MATLIVVLLSAQTKPAALYNKWLSKSYTTQFYHIEFEVTHNCNSLFSCSCMVVTAEDNVSAQFKSVMLDIPRDAKNFNSFKSEKHKLTVQMEKDEVQRRRSVDETSGYAEAMSRMLFHVFISMVRYVFELRL